MRLSQYNKTLEIRDSSFRLVEEEAQIAVLIEKHKDLYCLKHGWIMAQLEYRSDNYFNLILYDNYINPPPLKIKEIIRLEPASPKDILEEVRRLINEAL